MLLLEEAKSKIRILEGKVELLEANTADLQEDLDIAHTKIEDHHGVFRELLADSHINLEEQDDSSDPEDNETPPHIPDSCNNNSPES